MKFVVFVSALLLPVISLAHDPSPLLADDGRDLSFLLKRYDGFDPILLRPVKLHTGPRTFQVEEVPVRNTLNGLIERQQCLACMGGCKIAISFLVRSHESRSSGCPDPLGDCCQSHGCCSAGRVDACTPLMAWQIPDSVFHRSALRSMELLGAALVV